MKSVTEFANLMLKQALTSKNTLISEGKSPEEVQTSLGTTFKYEGEKLKHFINAIDVAEKNLNNLRRIVVMTLTEGEKIPNKAVKVDEHYYVPEMLVSSVIRPPPPSKKRGKGGGGGKPSSGRGGHDAKKKKEEK